MKRLADTQAFKDTQRLLDRDTLLRLAWKEGHQYPPEQSSVDLAQFLKRRGIGVLR